MFLGNSHSVRQVARRVSDAATSVDQRMRHAHQAITAEAGSARPDEAAVVHAMLARWDEVQAELRTASYALGDAAAILNRLARQIDDVTADWSHQVAQVRSNGLTVAEYAGWVDVTAAKPDDQDAATTVSAAQSALDGLIQRARTEQQQAGTDLQQLRLPSELTGAGSASFGTVSLLGPGSGQTVDDALDRLARIHDQLERLGGRAR